LFGSPRTARSSSEVDCKRVRRVLGAGSGVSTVAVQLAVQAGARVIVTSSSDEKIERVKAPSAPNAA